MAKALTGNVLELEVIESDFQLIAIGFDVHRDLFVRIDETDGQDTDKGPDEGQEQQ